MRLHEKGTEAALFASALFLVAVTAGILLFLLVLGLPLLREGLSASLCWTWRPEAGLYGILPMVAGTLAVSGTALLVSFPLSLGSASLICVVARGRTRAFLRKSVEAMTAIPPVVYAFASLFLLVPFLRDFLQEGSGMCLLAASLVLAVLVAPTMILMMVATFEALPRSHLLALDSMGASPVQKLVFFVLPGAGKGILAAVILGLGRAMGDTLIPLMLAGNAPQVAGLADSVRTLTAHIALVNAANFDSPIFRSSFTAGILLYATSAAAVSVLRLLHRRRRLIL